MKLHELINLLKEIEKEEGDLGVYLGFEGQIWDMPQSMIHLRDGDHGHNEPNRLVILGED